MQPAFTGLWDNSYDVYKKGLGGTVIRFSFSSKISSKKIRAK